MDEVEKLSKDLFEYMNDPLLWEAANQDKKCKSRFMKLSRFVLRREIEAKIEGYEKAKAFFIINEQNSEAFEIINLNIAELRKQLEKIGE